MLKPGAELCLDAILNSCELFGAVHSGEAPPAQQRSPLLSGQPSGTLLLNPVHRFHSPCSPQHMGIMNFRTCSFQPWCWKAEGVPSSILGSGSRRFMTQRIQALTFIGILAASWPPAEIETMSRGPGLKLQHPPRFG